MTALEQRLRDLGDALALDESTVADDVVARIASGSATAAAPTARDDLVTWTRADRSRRLLLIAATVIAVVAATLAVPSARQAVADWFGLDGVTIEGDSRLDAPATADPIDEAADAGLGTVSPDDDGVLVSSFAGSLDTDALTKIVGDGTVVRRVEVGGAPGLWIDGEPHEVVYRDPRGDVVVERFAGNTLLWQDGDTIRRLEGFATLDAALARATTP